MTSQVASLYVFTGAQQNSNVWLGTHKLYGCKKLKENAVKILLILWKTIRDLTKQGHIVPWEKKLAFLIG